MSLSPVFFPHLDRVLARQRRQMVGDLLLWSAVAVSFVAGLLSA